MEQYQELLEPIIVDITDFAGFKRKVKVNFLTIDEDMQEIRLNYTLFSYSPEGVERSGVRKNGFLKATMENYVNAQGDYVTPQTEGAIPEYLFYLIYMQQQTFNRATLYTEIIDRADQQGRFDFN